jgi:sulfide:quinone oxidoreductase
MNMKKLSPRVFVSGQITTTDVGAASAQGIRTIINNRPDNETIGQPLSADLAVAAAALEMRFIDVPVLSSGITEENIEQFDCAYQELQAPVLIFCRSGTRSISLWALNEAKNQHIDDILAATSAAGYDLSAMRAMLVSRSSH